MAFSDRQLVEVFHLHLLRLQVNLSSDAYVLGMRDGGADPL
jgi:hypothetical protein